VFDVRIDLFIVTSYSVVANHQQNLSLSLSLTVRVRHAKGCGRSGRHCGGERPERTARLGSGIEHRLFPTAPVFVLTVDTTQHDAKRRDARNFSRAC
jgi:hypothetical protein